MIPGTVDCTFTNPLETRNLSLTSTFVVQGSCSGVVFAIGDRSILGRIVAMSREEKFRLTTKQKEVWFFTKVISTVAPLRALHDHLGHLDQACLPGDWVFDSLRPSGKSLYMRLQCSFPTGSFSFQRVSAFVSLCRSLLSLSAWINGRFSLPRLKPRGACLSSALTRQEPSHKEKW
jgi:hypothetical protein